MPGRGSAPGRTELGCRAEELVARGLEAQGYLIVGRNARVGRLELDIIARRGRTLIVCEVRARRDARWVHPAETIDSRKQSRIRQATARWLAVASLGPVRVRFDAAAVVFDVPEGRVQYYENAF